MKIHKKLIATSVAMSLGFLLFSCNEKINSDSSNSTTSIPAHDEHIYDDGVVTKEATCTEDGVKTFTCIYGDDFYTETIPSTGHLKIPVIQEEATCTKDGVMSHYMCMNCGLLFTSLDSDIPVEESDLIVKASHKYQEHSAIDATCETDGNIKYYTCENCDKYFKDGDNDTKVEVNETEIKTKAAGHQYQEHSATDATCETGGNIKYYTCENCDKYFKDGTDGTKVEVNETEVKTKAAGHKYQEHPAIEATCETGGNIKYYTCENCEKYFKDGTDGQKVEIAETEINVSAKNHNIEFVEEVPSTCENSGIYEHFECLNCHKYFNDLQGSEEIDPKTKIIPIGDHSLSERNYAIIYKFNDKATVGKVCTTCGQLIGDSSIYNTLGDAIIYVDSNYQELTSLFEIESENIEYPFRVDENGVWTNSNQNINGSSSYFRFHSYVAGTLEFDLEYDTESGSDIFHINNYSEAFSGKSNGPVHIVLEILADGSYPMYYSKDSSRTDGTDTIKIYNMKFTISEIPEGFSNNIPVSIVSFKDNNSKALDDIVMIYNSTSTNLPIISKDEKVFYSWKTINDDSGAIVDNNYIFTNDITLYAEFRDAITITYYELGEDNNPQTLVIAKDTVPNLPTPHKDGFMFMGWYTTNTFASESKYENTPLSENITLYAKFDKLPDYIGRYYGIQVNGTTGKGDIYFRADTSKRLGEIYEDFSFYSDIGDNFDNPLEDERGVIDNSSYNPETHIFEMTYNGQLTYGFLFEEEGIIVVNSREETVGQFKDDVMIYVKEDINVSFNDKDNNCATWDRGYKKLVEFTYGDKTTLMYIDAREFRVYLNVTLTDFAGNNVNVSDVYNGKSYINQLVISCDGQEIDSFGLNDDQFVERDGKQGTYSGELGNININGIGKLTIDGDDDISYTILEEGNIIFTFNKSTKIIKLNKDDLNYEIVLDQTFGLFTGEKGNFESNGDGTGTLDGKDVVYSYNIDDPFVLTVTKDDSSIEKITLNIDENTYSLISLFGGHTFTGTFYSVWDEGFSSIKIIFDDSDGISGVLYSGYGTTYYFYFTGEFDNETSTLTLTITRAIDSSAPNKVITIQIEGNTMTITSCTIANSAYSFANQGTLTSDTFTL